MMRSLLFFFGTLSCFWFWVPSADAADFVMQTGYYIGDGYGQYISGLGFTPELVMVSDETAAGNDGTVFWTTDMGSSGTGSSAKIAEAEANATGLVEGGTGGFSVGNDVDVNGLNLPMRWVAFGGSDCTANGTFCVGTYTGNGSTKSVNTGFQPDLVVVKRSGASLGVWKSSSMATNETNYFSATGSDMAGQMIQSLSSSGFTVGNNATVNTLNNQYWFFAFKEVPGKLEVGSYTGDGQDNRNIDASVNPGLAFQPDFVWTKATAAVAGAFSVTEQINDNACLFTDSISAQNIVQSLLSTGGFQIGSGSESNHSGSIVHYVAFGGVSDVRATSGSYRMVSGWYNGSGSSFYVSGIGFSPDLVIIKAVASEVTPQHAVFRTSMMKGNSTAYFANPVANFSGGIVSLDPDGFTLGTHATVNSSVQSYRWVAFGNAWRPDRNAGASDFMVGSYVATEKDNSDITRLPFIPGFISIKRSGANSGVWRSDADSGDISQFFSNNPESSDRIQMFGNGSFQVGVSDEVSTLFGLYHYFSFKSGSNVVSGGYTGSGLDRDVGPIGHTPNFLIVKKRYGGISEDALFGSSAYSRGKSEGYHFKNIPVGPDDRCLGVRPFGFHVEGNCLNEDTLPYRYVSFFGSEKTTVGSVGEQTPSVDNVSINQYMGGKFILSRDYGETFLKSIQISEKGTIDAQENIHNIKMYGEYDKNSPYDCESVAFDGSESQFGATVSEFSGPNGTALFDNGLSLGISINTPWTKVFCGYIVMDIGPNALSGQTIELEISNPAEDVFVWDGFTSPGTEVEILGTTIVGGSGVLSVDIVDNSGNSVVEPSVVFDSKVFSWNAQLSEGVLGVSNQKIRVTNMAGASDWSMSIAATGGSGAYWQNGVGNAYEYGGVQGYLTVDPSGAIITPQGGCSASGITKGSVTQFSPSVSSATLLSADTSAETGCYWDMTGIQLIQTIPGRVPTGEYSIDMTLTIL